ncbi:hypothetical protein C8R42DRAFT_645335 [Lentinula raphanica]|nr:hypothetical protein C8R42DRAFT_645335 [Lentinula raphanica]
MSIDQIQECEMLAIVHTLKKWRGYIEGSPIMIIYHPGHTQLAANALSRREGLPDVPEEDYQPLLWNNIIKTDLLENLWRLKENMHINKATPQFVLVPTAVNKAFDIIWDIWESTQSPTVFEFESGFLILGKWSNTSSKPATSVNSRSAEQTYLNPCFHFLK